MRTCGFESAKALTRELAQPQPLSFQGHLGISNHGGGIGLLFAGLMLVEAAEVYEERGRDTSERNPWRDGNEGGE